MSPSPVAEVPAAWAPLAAGALLAASALAAGLDAAQLAREEGRPWLAGFAVPWCESARLLRQRRRTTLAADRLLWRLGGAGMVTAALLMVAVIPWGRWTLADLPVGVAWFNAMDVLVWAAWWLTGWGANSAHALTGGYRFLAQALAYELPLMFALIAPAVGAGSLRMGDVVEAQHGLWFVVWMPVAFLAFCASVTAFAAWGPFADAVDPVLAGGVLAELSGVDRWLVLVGRWSLMTAGSAAATTLFLGGGDGPLLPAWLWFPVKTLALLAGLVLLRRRLPTVRPERLVGAAWLVVLPLTLLQLLVVSVVVVVMG